MYSLFKILCLISFPAFKHIVQSAAERLDKIISSAYPDRDVMNVIESIRNNYDPFFIEIADFVLLFDQKYPELDKTEKEELINFGLSKLLTLMREFQELCVNLTGR